MNHLYFFQNFTSKNNGLENFKHSFVILLEVSSKVVYVSLNTFQE